MVMFTYNHDIFGPNSDRFLLSVTEVTQRQGGSWSPVNRFGYIGAKHNSSNHRSKSVHSSRHSAVSVWRGFGDDEVVNREGLNQQARRYNYSRLNKMEPLIALGSQQEGFLLSASAVPHCGKQNMQHFHGNFISDLQTNGLVGVHNNVLVRRQGTGMIVTRCGRQRDHHS